MVASSYNYVAKKVTNVNSGISGLWYQTNFNMPLHDFASANTPTYTQTTGPLSFDGNYSSIDLTGFSPGFEICCGFAIFLFDNTSGGSTFNGTCTGTISWTDTSGTVLHGGTTTESVGYSLSIPATYWQGVWLAYNIGCEASEIATSTTYDFRSVMTGSPSIALNTKAVSFTNVPSTATQSSNYGAIWVEGNNLCFINASGWKHTMVGNVISSTPGVSKAGVIWIDTTTQLLHWVGGNGDDYAAAWCVKQFASIFGNSSTGAAYAGPSQKGCIWMDNQFGQTHLGYIGSDGYKYLTGAGVNPY